MILAAVVVASILVAGATGTVAADPEIGASGNCDSADGENGGGGAAKLSEGEQDLFTPGEIQGTAQGVAWLLQNSAQTQSPGCEEGEADPSDPGDDYLEVHADSGEDGGAAQVCVDETTINGGNPVLAGGDADHDGDNPDRNCEYGQHQDGSQSPV